MTLKDDWATTTLSYIYIIHCWEKQILYIYIYSYTYIYIIYIYLIYNALTVVGLSMPLTIVNSKVPILCYGTRNRWENRLCNFLLFYFSGKLLHLNRNGWTSLSWCQKCNLSTTWRRMRAVESIFKLILNHLHCQVL